MQLFQPLAILEQKFHLPEPRVKLARRHHLLNKLTANEHTSLITIVSPAGFGKSTLMAQYLKQLKHNEQNKTVWIALDASDNEPNQFFSLLCHALVFINVADKSLITRAHNSSAKNDHITFNQDILNVIQQSEQHVYILFDDFHLISDPLILEFINRLIHYSPKQLHIVITSRVLPALELSHLYVQGLLISLNAEDLKFSMKETESLLNEYVNSEQLVTIHQETEGWPVALQLIRLWHQQNPNIKLPNLLTNNIDTLTSYMQEQILDKFDLQTQNFLLNTAFLDRFDIDLANYICDIDYGAQIIANINAYQSLIISLDANSTSFRYHHLFSDFLQQTLVARVGEKQCNELRCKAALWFANKNHLNEAVSQCVRAKNTTLAAKLIASSGGWEMIMTKGIGYVESLLTHFKKGQITNSPTLGLLQCYFYIKFGQVLLAEEQFKIAQAIHQDHIKSGTDSDASQRDFIVIELLLKLYLDQLTDINMLKEVTNAIQYLEKDDHLARGTLLALETLIYNQNGQFKLSEEIAIKCSREMQLANCWVGVNYITLHHGQSLAYRGHLEDAIILFNNASELAQKHLGLDSGLQSMARCLKADILYQMKELDSAKELLEQGITALELRDSWYEIYSVTFKLAINLAIAENDKTLCDNYIFRGRKIVVQRKLWRLAMLLDVLELKIALHFNETSLFEQLNNKIIREKYWVEELFLWKAKTEYHFILAVYFLQKNSSTKALFHADKMIKVCKNNEQLIDITRAKIIQALAYYISNNTDKSFKILTEVCSYCIKYKIKQVFFEVPASIESLLIKFRKHLNTLTLTTNDLNFINDILHLYKHDNDAIFSKFNLSHREQQLIPLLIQGQSNKKMSITLGISENTIKFHLKNLFTKIDIHSRNEATVFFLTSGYNTDINNIKNL